jgi:phospholipid/cholesterol/gamma-HCH transport system substrate-binding protein
MASTNKLIVGLFVGGCLLLFGVGLFLIGNSNQLFTKSFDVHADFKKITGIQNGGKVRVGGMDAGTVTEIEVPQNPEGKFRVHFRIVEKLHPIVRQDSVASIQTDGLLGNKYLQVDAGSSTSATAKSDSLIRSAEPFEWGDLMAQISDTVKQANGILAGVKDQVITTLEQIEVTVKSANGLIQDASPQVQGILVSANRISANMSEILDGVQAGKGTIGALLKDRAVYNTIARTMDKGEKISENLSETSARAANLIKRVDESEIVPEVQKTVKTLREITAQLKEAVGKFQSAGGEGGVTENLQRTLADAHEAMSDLSDNTEALKHNFFFRGFFKGRGFYDLGGLTVPEYKSAAFAKGFKTHRVWLDGMGLFQTDAKGEEVLTADGKAKLDEAMTELLAFPRNGPLIVEGFAGEGTASQQYLRSRRRAQQVETYIVGRFRLRPAYVGIAALGSEKAVGGGAREGVGIVSYYK